MGDACAERVSGRVLHNHATTRKWACKPAPPAPKPSLRLKKTLGAPNIIGDIYLNLLDVSPSQHLALALSGELYTYNMAYSQITNLNIDTGDDEIFTSLRWLNSKHLIYGTSSNYVGLYDCTEKKICREQQINKEVDTLIPGTSSNNFFAGTKEGSVILFDTRTINRIFKRTLTSSSTLHRDRISSLALSPNNKYIAVGTNGDEIHLIDLYNTSAPVTTFVGHTSAVMSMLWLNNQQLVSGGGTNDRTVRIWNVNTGKEIKKNHTGEQLTGLFLSTQGELVTTHGSPGNSINIYNQNLDPLLSYPKAHQNRITFSAIAPGAPGTDTLLTASGDERLKIWDIKRSKPKGRQPQRRRAFNHYPIR